MDIEEAASVTCFQKSKRMQNHYPWNIVPTSQPILQTVRDDNAVLVRSPQSCCLDLRQWGAQFQSNRNRLYFEGHERKDVLDHRAKFIEYFLARRDHD